MTAASADVAIVGKRVIEQVERVVVGKRRLLEQILTAVLAGGHVLMEDYPGLAKTLTALSFAEALGLDFKRIQFTPDLLPSDITGSVIYDRAQERFELRKGPIFANIVLADEINRASPKTQSALLEAMQEGHVTLEGETMALPEPFIVIATQNPIEYEGTFPLPEAQLDRFLLRLSLGYPNAAQEKQLLPHLQYEHPITKLQQVTDETKLLEFQKQVWDIHVDDSLQEYIVKLVGATRDHSDLILGASPRASLALFKTAQALAAVRGRDHAIPDDIKYLTPFALAHRLIIKPEAELRGQTTKSILHDIVERTPLDIGQLGN